MVLAGTTYRTTKNLSVQGTIHFDKPVSDSFEFEIPSGEEFRVSVWTEPFDNFIQIWLLNSKVYERAIVGDSVLASPYYNSYSLTLDRNRIQQDCVLTTNFEEAIYFYSPNEKYGEFSNFAEFGFVHDHLYYPTVEHFYQSKKFIDVEYAAQIRKAKSAKDASILGKSKVVKLRKDWEEAKTDIMFLGVKGKFEAHETLKKKLLSTDEMLIIENSPYDNYWGIGRTGQGMNQLGAVLMRVRQILRNAT